MGHTQKPLVRLLLAGIWVFDQPGDKSQGKVSGSHFISLMDRRVDFRIFRYWRRPTTFESFTLRVASDWYAAQRTGQQATHRGTFGWKGPSASARVIILFSLQKCPKPSSVVATERSQSHKAASQGSHRSCASEHHSWQSTQFLLPSKMVLKGLPSNPSAFQSQRSMVYCTRSPPAVTIRSIPG